MNNILSLSDTCRNPNFYLVLSLEISIRYNVLGHDSMLDFLTPFCMLRLRCIIFNSYNNAVAVGQRSPAAFGGKYFPMTDAMDSAISKNGLRKVMIKPNCIYRHLRLDRSKMQRTSQSLRYHQNPTILLAAPLSSSVYKCQEFHLQQSILQVQRYSTPRAVAHAHCSLHV